MLARSLARLGRAPLNRGVTKPENPRNLQQWVNFCQQVAGVQLSMDDALQVSVVWACVSAISKAIAASRWKVFEVLPDGDRDELPFDPLVAILNTRPNADMTAIAAREAQLIAALTWGNGYWEIVYNRAERVSELWPMLPDRVTPERNPETGEKQFRYANPDFGGEVVLPAWKVFHLQGPSINGLLGDNHVAKAAKAIALSKAAETFSSSYFGNGTILSGVLEYPHSLDDEAYKRLQKSWEDRHQGPGKANKPALLEGGLKWTAIGTDPEKSQLVESRKFGIEEICRWYGVPPHKVGHLDRATWNNIEHLGLEFTRDALTPWARRLEQEADYKLLSPRGRPRFTLIDLEWLSQGDAKSRAEAKQILRRNGVYSVNDWLRSEGMNTIGAEGDVRIVEANMQRLDQVGQLQPTRTAPAASPAVPAAQPENIATEAVEMLMASVFQRHIRRLENRQRDLERGGNSRVDIAAHLQAYWIQLEPTLREELAGPCAVAEKLTSRSAAEILVAAVAYLRDRAECASVRDFLEQIAC